MDLNKFHKLNAIRASKDFSPEHGLLALIVCLQEEVGELAEACLGITGEKARKIHLTKKDALKEVADAITYLSLIASKLECTDLESLIINKFNEVSDRVGSNIKYGE